MWLILKLIVKGIIFIGLVLLILAGGLAMTAVVLGSGRKGRKSGYFVWPKLPRVDV